MYKLLTTAAVIMTVATPSIANQWTGHKDIVNNLKDTYGYLDGEAQFGALEGAYDADAAIGAQTGQLSNFFDTVDKGVTYITLTVDPATNAITPGIKPGVAFSEITDAKDELVQRVNYDLFVSTTDEAVTGFDRTNGTYDDVKQQNLTITGTPENSNDNDYTSNHNGGLAGVKIAGLVTDVNTINEFLIDSGTSASQSQAFILEYGAGTGNTAGVEIADVFNTIDDLNNAIALGQDNADGTGNFFGNIDIGGLSETNVNDFAIPAYNAYNDIGDLTTVGFESISDWASGVHTVTVTDGSSTIKTDGSVVITDAAAGTVTVSGSTDSTDGVYTLTGGVFVKG